MVRIYHFVGRYENLKYFQLFVGSESSQKSLFKSPSKVPAHAPKTSLRKKERKAIPEVPNTDVVPATEPELEEGKNLLIRCKFVEGYENLKYSQ